jgi:DMSO/TMAO reductase YedYZ molybdopterin-dependent catalytic subunit
VSIVDAKKVEDTQTKIGVPSGIGMIIRQKDPINFEFPFDKLDSFLTPSELFYVRSHFKGPELTADSYRLRIHGAVENPVTLSYRELREFPTETRTATLECAGNSRVFLVPQVEGAQWELGAVGNAEWTGVPLRVLLEQTGLAKNACEVVFEGADRGTPKEEPRPPGPISYARSIPLETAVRPEVLVVYQMNAKSFRKITDIPFGSLCQATTGWHRLNG